MTTTAIATRSDAGLTPVEARSKMQALQAVVKELMVKGLHYGEIPGTGTKPTLLQPGAQFLSQFYGLRAEEHVLDRVIEQWDVPITDTTFPLFAYRTKITFFNAAGERVAVGVGDCNSYESRYRFRDERRKCPTCGKATLIKTKVFKPGDVVEFLCWKKEGKSDGCGTKYRLDDPAILNQTTGKIPNAAIHDQINTILKISKKRAFVNGVIEATGTSEFFTQDMEDFSTIDEVTAEVLSSTPAGGAKEEKKEEEKKVLGPGDFIVTEGLHRGKRVSELTEAQLTSIITTFGADPKKADLIAACQRFGKDVFGGVFDQRPEGEKKDAAAEKEKAEAEATKKEVALIFATLRSVIPNISDKEKVTDADKKDAADLCGEAFGVRTSAGLLKQSPEALKKGHANLRILVKQVKEAQASASKKGAKK